MSKVKRICEVCGKEFERYQSKIDDAENHFCSEECQRKYFGEHQFGENNPAWKCGISFEPYCPKFNSDKREEIREKYGRKCFICGKSEEETGRKLSCHHVDYNKNQGCGDNKWALVPLCGSCHSKTNNNRKIWEVLIKYKLWCEKQHDSKC